MDANRIYGISCKYSSERHLSHAVLNDVVRRAPVTSGIDRGDGKRTYDISVFLFCKESVCLDATCVDTYAETHVNSSAVTPGAAANAAGDDK